MPKNILFATFSCALFIIAPVFGDGDVLKAPEPVTEILRNTAMPELDDSRVGKILSQYYINGLGGKESWQEVESFQLEGTLALEEVDLILTAFQKKPYFLKMAIQHPETDIPIQMGFDGKVAWEQMPGAEAKPMGEQETRRFAHSSYFGSHLLYPFREGKSIRYVDTVPVDGEICHHLEVTTATGYVIDYFINIRTFLDEKVSSLDTTSGFVSTLVYTDYTVEYGLPISTTIESYENGELVSTFEIEEIKLNPGLMPWMFNQPRE